MATVNGTDGNDLIHRSGDDVPRPPGYTNVTGVTRGDDSILGGSGDDLIHADEGYDTILGDTGDDIVYADSGYDVIYGGSGTDELHGGDGNDAFVLNEASEISGLAETLDGGEGNDLIVLDPRSDDQVFDLTQASMISVRGIIGPNHVDRAVVLVTASQFAEFGYVSASNADIHVNGTLSMSVQDTAGVIGSLGWHDLFLGDGADRLVANTQANWHLLSAGGGDDWIEITDRFGIQTLRIDGGAGSDRLRIHGSVGGSPALLDGGTGRDRLKGGTFEDTLLGGEGDDVLHGDRRADLLTGGEGADRFRYTSANDSKAFTNPRGETLWDTIADFDGSEGDKVDLGLVDGDAVQDGQQAFHLGGATFTQTPGELIQYQQNGTTFLAGDTDGDAEADFLIQFTGLLTLSSSDLLLT